MQSIEDTLENPDALLEDIIGFSISEAVESVLDSYPDIPDLASYENLDINFSGYLPLLDITGPFSFYPSHCYPGKANEEE